MRIGSLKLEVQIDLQEVAENEHFLTLYLQASQISIRNHEKEKLEALRAAVTNTGLEIELEDTFQLKFLNLIDAFSPWRTQLLHLFSDDED